MENDLTKDLQLTPMSVSACRVLAAKLVHSKHPGAKHEGCIVKSEQSAMGHEVIRAAG